MATLVSILVLVLNVACAYCVYYMRKDWWTGVFAVMPWALLGALCAMLGFGLSFFISQKVSKPLVRAAFVLWFAAFALVILLFSLPVSH